MNWSVVLNIGALTETMNVKEKENLEMCKEMGGVV